MKLIIFHIHQFYKIFGLYSMDINNESLPL